LAVSANNHGATALMLPAQNSHDGWRSLRQLLEAKLLSRVLVHRGLERRSRRVAWVVAMGACPGQARGISRATERAGRHADKHSAGVQIFSVQT